MIGKTISHYRILGQKSKRPIKALISNLLKAVDRVFMWL